MNTTRLFPAETAVLAEFRTDASLYPFLRHRPAAMLPVLGKPVIHHWLNALRNAGVKQVLLLVSDFPEQVRAYVGRGERWGFDQVEYISTRTLNDWQEVTRRVPADMLDAAAFCSLNAMPVEPLNRMAESAAFWLPARSGQHRQRQQALTIQSPMDLWAANMALASQLAESSVEPGSFIDPAVRLEGRNYVDSRVVVDRQNKLINSVIGKDVRINESCELDQAVILPDTQLGSHLKVTRKIIDGATVYDVDSNCTLTVDDPRLFTRLTRAKQKITLGERALALVLLVATAPFVLLTPREKQVISVAKGESFDGDLINNDIEVTSLKTASRFAKRIPWLRAVIRGELPLFGIREQGQLVSERPGVISLADFGEQSEVGITIANQYQTHTNSFTSNLALAGKWLPRAITRK